MRKTILAGLAALMMLTMTGCFDSRNLDLTYATAIVPKHMMKYKVGEYSILYELYSYSKREGYDFYVGLVKEDYDNGEEYLAMAQENGTDRWIVTEGDEGHMYTEGMVFDQNGKAVLLTAEYGDPSLQSMFEEVFASIQFKDAADYPAETPSFLQ